MELPQEVMQELDRFSAELRGSLRAQLTAHPEDAENGGAGTVRELAVEAASRAVPRVGEALRRFKESGVSPSWAQRNGDEDQRIGVRALMREGRAWGAVVREMRSEGGIAQVVEEPAPAPEPIPEQAEEPAPEPSLYQNIKRTIETVARDQGFLPAPRAMTLFFGVSNAFVQQALKELLDAGWEFTPVEHGRLAVYDERRAEFLALSRELKAFDDETKRIISERMARVNQIRGKLMYLRDTLKQGEDKDGKEE